LHNSFELKLTLLLLKECLSNEPRRRQEGEVNRFEILDLRFEIDPTDKCGGLRIFDFGLIPRINHVAGTTFEIRLSEKEEKKAILAIALKTVGLWALQKVN
jgi:hypothetical protein